MKSKLLITLSLIMPALLVSSKVEPEVDDGIGISNYQNYEISNFEKGETIDKDIIYSMDIKNTGDCYISLEHSNLYSTFKSNQSLVSLNQIICPQSTLSISLASDLKNLNLDYINKNVSFYAFKSTFMSNEISISSWDKCRKTAYSYYDEIDIAHTIYYYSFEYRFSISNNLYPNNCGTIIFYNIPNEIGELTEHTIFYYSTGYFTIESYVDVQPDDIKIGKIYLVDIYNGSKRVDSLAFKIIIFVVCILFISGLIALIVLVNVFNKNKKKKLAKQNQDNKNEIIDNPFDNKDDFDNK